jgi:hypothetical protein
MKKNIILYARAGQTKLYPLIAKKLNNYDYCYIVQNEDEEREIRRLDKDVSINIYNITSFISANWKNESYLNIDLSNFEKEYKIDSLWNLFYFDRFLVKYNYFDAVKLIKLHIAFTKLILEKEKPDYFVNEEIAIFFPFLFAKISVKENCKYVGFSVPKNYAYSKTLFKDENGQYPQLNKIYFNRNITAEELVIARKSIENIVASKDKPEYMLVSGKRPQLSVRDVYRLGKYFFSLFNRKNHYDYEGRNNNQYYLENSLFYFRQLNQKYFFKKPNFNDKYILYPLHYTPEATTLVSASFFEKQLIIIDFLAKSIPGDMILYVKEHYAKLGHKPTSFYKEIKESYPNVKLIDPWADSFKLIEKSQAVAVLTSTAGWEALMCQKPVIIFGDVFYDKFKYAHKIDLISNRTLAKDIKHALETKIDKQIYNEEFNYFFASYLKAMKNGNYCLGQNDYLNVSNVDELSNSLLEYLEEVPFL